MAENFERLADEEAPDLWEPDKWDQLAVTLLGADNITRFCGREIYLKTEVFVANILENIP